MYVARCTVYSVVSNLHTYTPQRVIGGNSPATRRQHLPTGNKGQTMIMVADSCLHCHKYTKCTSTHTHTAHTHAHTLTLTHLPAMASFQIGFLRRNSQSVAEAEFKTTKNKSIMKVSGQCTLCIIPKKPSWNITFTNHTIIPT